MKYTRQIKILENIIDCLKDEDMELEHNDCIEDLKMVAEEIENI